MRKLYYTFNNYLKERFGTKVHRLSLNAGFDCPNRDGSVGREGCIFCNEKGFSHFAETNSPLKEQIKTSITFARNRFKAEKFIAYFQNATNTYAPAGKLKEIYGVIREFNDIVGLFISTRPDCIDEEKLDAIESFSGEYETWIEYGMQSMHDATLRRINRGHNYEQFQKAVLDTAKRKIKIGTHVILGLPDESRDDMLKTAESIADLPIKGVKLHVLHVLKDTKLEGLFKQGKVKLLELEEYINLACDFIERLKPGCVILRLVSDAKRDMLVAPEWINEKQKVIEKIEKEFKRRKTASVE